MSEKPVESIKQGSGDNEPEVVSTGTAPVQPTVSRILPELQTKHPLQNTWDLWYYKNVSSVFEENLFNITSVDTVEDFWGLFNHIEYASKLNLNCAYYFFKKGIRPMWEDPINKSGGRWLINVKKVYNNTDEFWLELLLCLIGEGFDEYNDYVCGAFVVIKRSQDRIGIWTKEASNRDANLHIGNVIKKRTKCNGLISFEPHDSSKTNSYQL
ncbi:eukaryotic translation initiation factor 4E-like [Dermatophagoides pteronyssinus]|uniref:Translation initiation factor eIF4E n=2 Tax=Dermatophagoides pteronyssinus TaxID=6956 RepID=A0ABQ8JHX4_DERPT|nr:eukaryotic translation initiation factor 4E-like [Dermatophagoides pteronyssinus]KAH9422028.1 translation initiation factor eIF4E [Dermatophagoides pteronyssinus]